MFMDSVDELRRWMANYSKKLQMVKMPGALPESAQKEFDKFVVCYYWYWLLTPTVYGWTELTD